MRPDRLTLKLQEALQDAQGAAQEHRHQRLEPEHLLVAVLRQEEGLVRQVVEKVGVPSSRLRTALEERLTTFPSISGDDSLYLSDRLTHLLGKEEVSDEDIAEVVSSWTGIPVARLLETERRWPG